MCLKKDKQPATDTVDHLVHQLELERQAEGDRFKKNKECLTISAFNPRSTKQRAERRHRDLMRHVRNWSLKWWEKRGYTIEFEGKISTAGKLAVSDKASRRRATFELSFREQNKEKIMYCDKCWEEECICEKSGDVSGKSQTTCSENHLTFRKEIQAMTLDKAEILVKNINYTIRRSGYAGLNSVNWDDAAAFFLEGYEFARNLQQTLEKSMNKSNSKEIIDSSAIAQGEAVSSMTSSAIIGVDPAKEGGDKAGMRCSCGWRGEISAMGQGSDWASKYYECPKCKKKYD